MKSSERKKERRERVPFGGHRTKLQLSERDLKDLDEAGWVPRWFNDHDGRIQAAEAGGYVPVTPEEAPSIGVFDSGNSDMHGRVSRIVSKGGGDPVRAFLMKIQKVFYIEDQEAKEDRNRMVDEALRAGQPGGNVVENQYVPKGHIQQV